MGWNRIGRTAAKCGPAARSRKGEAQRNLVRDPAQKCAAQRLIAALRQNGSALRAESLRWTPDTPPLALQGSGDVPHAALWGSRDVPARGTLSSAVCAFSAQVPGSPLRSGRDNGSGVIDFTDPPPAKTITPPRLAALPRLQSGGMPLA